MIVSWKEVRHLEDFIQKYEIPLYDATELPFRRAELPILRYFALRPHLLMPCGFDEHVSFRTRKQFKNTWITTSDWVKESTCGESLYRKPTGQWFWLASPSVGRWDDFHFDTKSTIHEEEYALTITFDELFKNLYRVASDEKPGTEERLWSPALWTPAAQEKERSALVEIVQPVLTAIRSEAITLESLTWRQLEEVVAEVLRASGLEIHLVQERPQGGRDIVARGELIPGQEPLELAIEVKHQKIVDRPQIEAALWQNRAYPALLFATSGRFTAGVLQEKANPANRLRLFLKDGEALGDMIRDYPLLKTNRVRWK
jgi:Restriction endonuclease